MSFFFFNVLCKTSLLWSYFGKLPQPCEVRIPSGWCQVPFEIYLQPAFVEKLLSSEPWCCWTDSYCVVTWSSPLRQSPMQSHGFFFCFWILMIVGTSYAIYLNWTMVPDKVIGMKLVYHPLWCVINRKCNNFLKKKKTNQVWVTYTRSLNSKSGMTVVLLYKGYCCCCEVASVVSDSVWPYRWQPTRLPHPWDSPGKNTGVGCHFLLQCMKVKSEWSHSVVSDSLRPHGLQPTRLLHPWDFPGKSTGVGAIAFSDIGVKRYTKHPVNGYYSRSLGQEDLSSENSCHETAVQSSPWKGFWPRWLLKIFSAVGGFIWNMPFLFAWVLITPC